MKNLVKRTLTGIVLVVLVIATIILDQYLFVALFLILTVTGLWEFYSLVEKAKVYPNKAAGTFAGLTLFITNAIVAMNYAGRSLLLLNFLFFFLIFLFELYRNTKDPFTNIAFTFFGLLYVAVPFSLLNYFPNPGFLPGVYHSSLLLGFFFLVWINETGAYVIGSSFGRHYLFKRVSPKKTWEGVAGGGVLSFIAAFLISIYYKQLSLDGWLIVAGIVVILGTYGDLFESMFKRCIKAKDSGNILPGHGGILDRFDGVFMAAPFVFVYLLMAYS